jgi:nucleoside-diphosphate-sugar epimerase
MTYGPDRKLGASRVETEYPEPISVYGASKVAVEALMNGFRGQYGIDPVALRFSHVYGEGRTTQCFVRDMLAAASISIDNCAEFSISVPPGSTVEAAKQRHDAHSSLLRVASKGPSVSSTATNIGAAACVASCFQRNNTRSAIP